MISDKSSKNKVINAMQLVLFAVISLLLAPVALAADSPSAAFDPTIPILMAWVIALFTAFKNPRIGLILSAVFGALIAGYLGYQHFLDAPVACGVDNLSDCSAVNQRFGKLSDHSDALPDYPIAFLGLSFYIALICLTFFALKDESGDYKLAPQFAFSFGVIGVVAAFVMAGISHFTVGAWCKYCIGMYGFNIICFLAAFLWEKRGEKGSRIDALLGNNDRSMLLVLGTTTLSVFLLGILFGSPAESADNSDKSTSGSVKNIELTPSNPVNLDGSEPALGPKSARFTLVEFADFECPACAEATPKLKQILNEHKADLRLLYKHYPLSSICNDEIPQPAHDRACAAAVASDCAQNQGRFWEMNRLLFINQNFLETKNLELMADQIRLDATLFKSCLETMNFDGIKSDIAAAKAVGIDGTPSIFLHDTKSDKWYKVASIDQIPGMMLQLDSSVQAKGSE